jgi:hypothetical protein
MKYAIHMGSGAMMYIPSFIKIGSGLQKIIGGEDMQTQGHTDSMVISYAYFYFSKYGR